MSFEKEQCLNPRSLLHLIPMLKLIKYKSMFGMTNTRNLGKLVSSGGSGGLGMVEGINDKA